MAIDKKFSVPQFEAYLSRCRDYAMRESCRALAFLAEKCVNRIRDRSSEDSWIDHTGNLRSSIGYLITMDGKPITQGGFKPTEAPGGNGGEGQQVGAKYVSQIASRYASEPLVLVVVAGMEYALFVEALDNKDVLADTELWARSEWKKQEPMLRAKIERGWETIAREINVR